MENKQEVLRNPLFADLEKIGSNPEKDIYTWAQGLGFHNLNLQKGLKQNVTDSEVRQNILKDLWTNFYNVGMEKPNKVLEVTADPNLEAINRKLYNIMLNEDHPAIMKMGDFVEEAILNWVRAFAVFDWGGWTFMEKWLGAKKAMDIYMGLWEAFSLSELNNVKSAVGIKDDEKVTMKQLGLLSKVYWESIGCPYKVTQDTEDVHEAEIEDCPYWQNMKSLLGEERARSMTLKTEAVVSVNYYDVILRALGVFDKYSFTMDKFLCCGDDCCRVRFERKK